jgi:hypothetical protein
MPAPFPAEPEAEEIGALGDEPLGITGDDEPIGIVDETPRRRPEPEIELEVDGVDDAPPLLSEAGSNDLVDFDEGTDTAAPPESEPDLELVGDFEEEKPAPPSWSEILQDCLFLARAKGALLISPEGTVTAFCGEWPVREGEKTTAAERVEAIAVRLVPAMEKALKGAPTRSVSVPLGAQHLTAWRVPLSSGLVTVGFVAEGQLKPEVRPTIDAELKRGAPD